MTPVTASTLTLTVSLLCYLFPMKRLNTVIRTERRCQSPTYPVLRRGLLHATAAGAWPSRLEHRDCFLGRSSHYDVALCFFGFLPCSRVSKRLSQDSGTINWPLSNPQASAPRYRVCPRSRTASMHANFTPGRPCCFLCRPNVPLCFLIASHGYC